MSRYLVMVVIVLASLVLPTASSAQNAVPLLTQIDYFTATCVPGGVLLEWGMASQVGITWYRLSLNGVQIAYIPSNCPGCMTPATYSFTNITPSPDGEYRLWHDIGVGGVGEAYAYISDCNAPVPTAVTLASFDAAATSHCHPSGSGKKTICVCRALNGKDKPAPMWRCR